MNRLAKCYALYAFIFLCACESGREATTKKAEKTAEDISLQDSVATENPAMQPDTAALPGQDSVELKAAFSNLLLAIRNQDSIALQKYIPASGVNIIEVPGAVPHFTHVKNINSFRRAYKQMPFFSIGEQLQPCVLQEGLPEFSCDTSKYGTKSGYSKEGCFVGSPGKFIKSNMWQYAGLNKAATKQIEETLPLLSKTIIHTGSSYKFHFGLENGRWKVYFIDLSVPCSA